MFALLKVERFVFFFFILSIIKLNHKSGKSMIRMVYNSELGESGHSFFFFFFNHRRLWIVCPHPLPSTLTAVMSCVQNRPGHAWQSGSGRRCCSRVTQPAQTTVGGGSRWMNVSIRCQLFMLMFEPKGLEVFAICKCLFKKAKTKTNANELRCLLHIVEAWSLMFCPPHAVRDVFNLFNFPKIYRVNPSLSVFPSYC